MYSSLLLLLTVTPVIVALALLNPEEGLQGSGESDKDCLCCLDCTGAGSPSW